MVTYGIKCIILEEKVYVVAVFYYRVRACCLNIIIHVHYFKCLFLQWLKFDDDVVSTVSISNTTHSIIINFLMIHSALERTPLRTTLVDQM